MDETVYEDRNPGDTGDDHSPSRGRLKGREQRSPKPTVAEVALHLGTYERVYDNRRSGTTVTSFDRGVMPQKPM